MAIVLCGTAIMTACGGDDPMITELPLPDKDSGQDDTTEITPDEGITLYGLVSDDAGNPGGFCYCDDPYGYFIRMSAKSDRQ